MNTTNLYDDVKAHIVALANKYPNEEVRAIFGGAISDIENTNNLEKFSTHLIYVARRAAFWKWHKGVADAMRVYCHLCYVDPYLIEAYCGTTFDEFEPIVMKLYEHKR